VQAALKLLLETLEQQIQELVRLPAFRAEAKKKKRKF
jgi:hypothetical protein